MSAKRFNTESIIKAIQDKFGDKFDCSDIIYKGMLYEIILKCNDCNRKFKIKPDKLFRSIFGCKNCYHKSRIGSIGQNRGSTKEFIEKAKTIHGNKFDYSLTEFKGATNNICVICNICKSKFFTKACFHLNGDNGGCRKCFSLNLSKNQAITKNDFVERANVFQKDQYEYISDYINCYSPITSICKSCRTERTMIAGRFLSNPVICKKCLSLKKISDFENRCRSTFGERYIFYQDYICDNKRIKITCKKHDISFYQRPASLFQNKESVCPKCKSNISRGEKLILDFLNNYNIRYEYQYSFDDCKNVFKLRFDFYLPTHNICIEFDGKQHFMTNSYANNDEELNKIKLRDDIKNRYCETNNIKLIRIPYTQQKNISNILKYELKII